MVVYLARGLAAAGHRATLIAGEGSDVPEATLVPVNLEYARGDGFDIRRHLPPALDILLTYTPLSRRTRSSLDSRAARQLAARRGRRAQHALSERRPRPPPRRPPRSSTTASTPPIFVSSPAKDDYDLFLGRLHGIKGYRWAIEGARRTGRRLLLAGGWRPSLSRDVRYVGQVGGERKAELLAGAACLWMPALWDEPFGLTLIEAMASGTPVLGTRRGALPEIVSPGVGALGDTVDELVALRAELDADRSRGLPGSRRALLHPSRDGGRSTCGCFGSSSQTGALPAGRPRRR